MIKITTRFKNTLCTHFAKNELVDHRIKLLVAEDHVLISKSAASDNELNELQTILNKQHTGTIESIEI